MNAPSAKAGTNPAPGDDAGAKHSLIHRLSLVLYPDTILRNICETVDAFDGTLRDMADEMFALMRRYQGIGLAAPQVGLRHRLMVCGITERLFTLTNFEVKDASEPRDFVEGCLSLPGVQSTCGDRSASGSRDTTCKVSDGASVLWGSGHA